MPDKKQAKAHRFTEAVDALMRKKLRTLREVTGLRVGEIQSLGSGTLNTYENHDISTFKLGDMAALAHEYGMSLRDFCHNITDDYASDDIQQEAANASRAGFYMRKLSPRAQSLAIEWLGNLVEYDQAQAKAS